MPWLCPACRTTLTHTHTEPRPRVVYRCHVCRLELRFNEETNQLELLPFPNKPERERDI